MLSSSRPLPAQGRLWPIKAEEKRVQMRAEKKKEEEKQRNRREKK